MFDPPKVRKGQKLKLLWGFFRPQFAYFCLFWHLERPRPASQWVRPNFFGPEGGQTIPPHHSIAKYLKNLKLIPRTTTFFLRHCVKHLSPAPIQNSVRILSIYLFTFYTLPIKLFQTWTTTTNREKVCRKTCMNDWWWGVHV